MNISVFDIPLEVYKSRERGVCHLVYNIGKTLVEVAGSRLQR